MKVFISYSRQDEVSAHLLAHLLNRDDDLECLIDRKVPIGEQFDKKLLGMIKDADVVLVLLSNASVLSAWVNQEIGFALALDKPIWPIALKGDIKPVGLISTIQSYSLFDWSNSEQAIKRLVRLLKTATPDMDIDDYYKKYHLDQVITNKVSRTKFIVKRLEELCKQEDDELEIYNQAAFSIFAASDHPLYPVEGVHTEEFVKELLEEKRLLNQLVRRKNTTFKMLLWPVRPYPTKHLINRYDTLLKWMTDINSEKDSNIEVRHSQYAGPNRLIIKDHFAIEGHKIEEGPGYRLNIVMYDVDKINKVINNTFAKI